MTSSNPGATFPFECDQCFYQAKHREALQYHIQSVHLGVKYSCDQCPKEFKSASGRNYHIYTAHMGLPRADVKFKGKKRFTCTYCSKMYCRQASLRIHMRKHTQEQPHQCQSPGCTERSHRKDLIRFHMQSKHDTKFQVAANPSQAASAFVPCPYCNRIYMKCGLENHLRTHTQEKPFACDLCEYRSKEAGALRTHFNRMHSDHPPLDCADCGKIFAHEENLRKHVRRVHGPKHEFTRCAICRKTTLTGDGPPLSEPA